MSVQGTLTTSCSDELNWAPYVFAATALTAVAAIVCTVSENNLPKPKTVEVIVGSIGTVVHWLSPLKKVVLFAVPPALKSAVTVTAPSDAVVGVKSINEPSVVVILTTPGSVYIGTSHLLSILKNLVVSIAVAPGTADKSIIPTVTLPAAVVFSVAADTYVPLALVKVSTPCVSIGTAHVSSPLKKVVPLAVPVADSEGVKTGSDAVPVSVKLTNVELDGVIVSTPTSTGAQLPSPFK